MRVSYEQRDVSHYLRSDLVQNLRDRLAQPGMLLVPGVYDGLSAKVAAAAGFAAIYVSGGAVARSTGVPDLGLLTLTETVDRLKQIVDAVAVPVIADADTGYGNALNVRRTVQEFERAGVAAFHLEDQETPKRCGHYNDKRIIPGPEMVTKVRAAVDARSNLDMLLIARTDALATEGVQAAVDRCHTYVDAGADIVFVEAPTSYEQIEQISKAFDVPLLINMFQGGKTPLLPASELDALGFKLALVPSDLQRAAIHGMQEAAATLFAQGTTAAMADRLVTFDDRDALIGLDKYQALESRYALPSA
jgi:2-methylisocitrate lyase-like PEP mutase family enzyme